MLSIRQAQHDDLELYFYWANNLEVRRNGFHEALIPLVTHQKWFLEKLNNPNTYFYVIEEEGVPIGQVRFDFEHDVAEVGYALDKQRRGKGFGKAFLMIAISRFFDDCARAHVICARVKTDNEVSKKILIALGFQLFGIENVTNAIIYQLFRSTWIGGLDDSKKET